MIKNAYLCSAKYRLFLSDFNETWIFSRKIDEKCTNIKFYGNQSFGSRVAPGECMYRLEAILNFANAPTNRWIFQVALCLKKR